MTRELKAFIFDLDGVITDTAEYHYLAWKQLAGELGVEFDREFNEQLKGVSRMDSLELILKKGGLENQYSIEEKEHLATKKNEHYKELIKQITPADLLPGILGLLKEIRDNKIAVAMASASKNAFTVVERLEVGEYFDYIVDAAKVEKGKPDPEIFLNAAEYLNIPAENCIGVEDAEAGVQAIKGAGMFAVGVGSKEAMSRADMFVNHTSELILDLIQSEFEQG
ncbi:beta-phosphoglucomutase [Bacillus marinisedimentorum]|uniref:beta-phosphoglucomutase n=1 Tax=Bacillus marinisedimentorum TaxID=1821260 RepID=UPI0007E19C0C|nr:beta-phosphoglucomutase [Bacillus marinisedimentorum]